MTPEKEEEELLEKEKVPESHWAAVIEAVLFTMGQSVELHQLAVAIEQDETTAKRLSEILWPVMREKTGGWRSLSWKRVIKCVQKPNFMKI